MTTTDKPGDPADKAADGAFGGVHQGVHSHRAGYGDDKLQRVVNWLRERPLATLASGEGGLLLAENDRLHAAIARVRALHAPYFAPDSAGAVLAQCCSECWSKESDFHYPCSTLRALDGDA